MRGGLDRVRPAITRNELGWLATLDDVESRLVFVDRDGPEKRYRAETGPFDSEYLQQLPKRDWTLLVHDVEKHLPAMRALFEHVAFIPDWRIDDLMVSFAAPGGGVGPHKDNYDVFLCQGIGVRNWRFCNDEINENPDASEDLALLREFESDQDFDTSEGDVLYLPPGVAHWGTAKRACITYSIGMRAPQASDICYPLNCTTVDAAAFYGDPDLKLEEVKPGYISSASTHRALALLSTSRPKQDEVAEAIGRFATRPKDWLTPDRATAEETEFLLDYLQNGGRLFVHGMTMIAFDDRNLYVNGSSTPLPPNATAILEKICSDRSVSGATQRDEGLAKILHWMAKHGSFEIPENS